MKIEKRTRWITVRPVFVNAFKDRREFQNLLVEFPWQSSGWMADEPEHMIHFNGEHLLDPYPDAPPSALMSQ